MSDTGVPVPLEVTGQTVEDAIEDGLTQLGLTKGDVIIEIVDEGSRGMLGLGSREACVRLIPLRPPRPVAPPSSQEDAQEADVALEVLQELLGRLAIRADIETHRVEPESPEEQAHWVLDIQGEDLGVLIGRRGETLGALQYITRLISSRELQRRARVIVDVQGYKTRRESTLRGLAVRMADQARQRGRVVTLEPMSPYERRIIHVTLSNDDTVTTESVGEGDRRRVTIIPARTTSKPSKSRSRRR